MSHEPNQTMPFYRSGLGNSAAYQVSGYPQVDTGTSAGDTVNYNTVTSQVTIANNTGTAISASFDGSDDFVLPGNNTITLNIKCRQIIITATSAWSICAALTTIDKNELPEP